MKLQPDKTQANPDVAIALNTLERCHAKYRAKDDFQ